MYSGQRRRAVDRNTAQAVVSAQGIIASRASNDIYNPIAEIVFAEKHQIQPLHKKSYKFVHKNIPTKNLDKS
jgi:hypothetical protein